MTARTRINIHPDFDVLAATTAARLITRLVDIQNERGEATVVLTGGSIGISTLQAVAESPACKAVNWARVNFWWGDERFVAADSEERNANQAQHALLSKIGVDPERVHAAGSADDFDSPSTAAEDYAKRLAEAAAAEHAAWTEDEEAPGEPPALPRFDILLLGVGPDAHIASLFPEMSGVRTKDRLVVGVNDAPKPPPARISLTLPAINSAQEVWLVVAGSDKAGAVGLALAGASPVQVPAAGPAGRNRTLWLIDHDAAAKVPENLIYREPGA